MVRRIRSALKTLEIAILNDVKSLPEATAASRANDRLGHTAEVQGLHSRAAATRAEPAVQIRNFDFPD
jgi:hypothetical protein